MHNNCENLKSLKKIFEDNLSIEIKHDDFISLLSKYYNFSVYKI